MTAHQHASRAAIPPPPREVVVSDPHNLERFVIAQDANGIYERAVAELRRGRKASHWMWFVFPQLAHPGQSPTSRRFAITSPQEATAYLQHPVLGPRLRQCAGLVATTADRTAEQIFGDVDAQKLHSCMTLFARVGPTEVVFEQVLHRYFASTAFTASTDTAGDLRSAVHAAGLAAGWRDVVRVAFVWTMSNGPLARRMGRWAALRLPFTGLLWFIGAALECPHTVRHDVVDVSGRTQTACAVLRPPHSRTSMCGGVLAAVLVGVLWAGYLVALELVLPIVPVIVLLIAATSLALLDLASDPLAGWWARGRREEKPPAAAKREDAVEVRAVAAYRRGRGAGGALMSAVNTVLDRTGTTATLLAREDQLSVFYGVHGYAPQGATRRMLRVPTGGPAA